MVVVTSRLVSPPLSDSGGDGVVDYVGRWKVYRGVEGVVNTGERRGGRRE